MTDSIKELANLNVVLLGVTETNVHLQTESGKGVKTITAADLGGGGGGSSTPYIDVLYTDDTSNFFVYKDTGSSFVAYKLPEGTVYTVGANPRPYQEVAVAAATTKNSLTISSPPQVVDIGQTSLQSAAVSATTNSVVLMSTVDCWISFDSNPTAVSGIAPSLYLSAGIPSYPIEVTPSVTKIAVIAPVSSGKLSIMELI